MRTDAFGIHIGARTFDYEPLRRLEAKCEATTMYTPVPSMDTVNAKLREMASGSGADAVIEVQYQSGMSMTSWKSMKATGLAVKKVSDEYSCPNCAETVKRAAKQCRFCASPLTQPAAIVPVENRQQAIAAEPLKQNDNSAAATVTIAVAVVIGIIMLITRMAG